MSSNIDSISGPTAAMLVIGDEILSGRTQDTNTQFIATKLTEVGINLIEVRIVSDSAVQIVSAVNDLRAQYDYLFTSGGIGPTHDDVTADAIADAFKVGISVRDDAKKILSSNYIDGEKALNDARLRMARIPDGALLIDNPISKAPGFSLRNVYVMAGVPLIFRAMVESIIPTLKGGPPLLSVSVRLLQPESEIAKDLEAIASDFFGGSIGSYPFNSDGAHGTNIVARHYDPKVLQVVKRKLNKIGQ